MVWLFLSRQTSHLQHRQALQAREGRGRISPIDLDMFKCAMRFSSIEYGDLMDVESNLFSEIHAFHILGVSGLRNVRKS